MTCEITAANDILVVDDDDMLRELMSVVLERAGYRVHVATDSATACAAVKGSPEVVTAICDFELDGGDNGVSLMRELRKLRSDIKVILVSGHPESLIRDALNGQHVRFLSKPFDPQTLINAVQDD